MKKIIRKIGFIFSRVLVVLLAIVMFAFSLVMSLFNGVRDWYFYLITKEEKPEENTTNVEGIDNTGENTEEEEELDEDEEVTEEKTLIEDETESETESENTTTETPEETPEEKNTEEQ